MNVLSIDYSQIEKEQEKIDKMKQDYNDILRDQILKDMKKFTFPKIDFEKSRRPNVCVQIKTLLMRNRTALKRDPMNSRVKVGQTVFMALLVLILFHDLNGRDMT